MVERRQQERGMWVDGCLRSRWGMIHVFALAEVLRGEAHDGHFQISNAMNFGQILVYVEELVICDIF
jgi:hypothetical protein